MPLRRSLLTGLLSASAIVLLAGCASSGSPDQGVSAPDDAAPSTTSSSTPDAVGTWRASEPDTAELTFDADGKVAGTDGCNPAGGTYRLDGGQVTFALDLTTLKACSGVTVSFLKLRSATIQGDTMTTFASDGSEIVTLRRQ
jgi:heat shock protein HslJ